MADLPREPADNERVTPRWARQIVQYVRSITPRSSNTCRVHRTTGGTTFQPTAKTTKPSRGGATTPTKYHPFQIIDTSTTVPQVQVSDGTLLGSFSAANSITIQNLNTNVSVTIDSLIFLYYDDALNEFGVTVDRVSSPAFWTGYPELVTITGTAPEEYQTQWFHLVGFVSVSMPSNQDTHAGFSLEINGSDCWVYQCLFTNLIIDNKCVDGTPVEYPFPWGRSYT